MLFRSSLTIDGRALESVNAHKVLGLTLQSNLEWDIKVTLMVSGASKRLHVFRELIRCGLSSRVLLSNMEHNFPRRFI